MSFAGARFSLWRTNQDGVIEIKGDRNAIHVAPLPQMCGR
jgi:hypothetical protein